MDVLTTHKDRLIQLAERLVAQETIEHDEFNAMFADLPDPRADAANAGGMSPKVVDPEPSGEPEPPAEPRGGTAPNPAPQPA